MPFHGVLLPQGVPVYRIDWFLILLVKQPSEFRFREAPGLYMRAAQRSAALVSKSCICFLCALLHLQPFSCPRFFCSTRDDGIVLLVVKRSSGHRLACLLFTLHFLFLILLSPSEATSTATFWGIHD